MQIRAFLAQDYEGIADVATVAEPERPITAQLLAASDAQRDPSLLFGRWVAERDGRVVGVAHYVQFDELRVPGEVHISVRVHPAYQRRGIGSALYETLIETLRRGAPVTHDGHVRREPVDTLKVLLRADKLAGMHFAARRGFIEYARRWESRLALEAFDPSAFPDPDAQMAEQGITLRSVAELASDPDRDRKLYALKLVVDQDIPYPDVVSAPAFEAFQKSVLEYPGFLPEGSYVAMDGDAYVGMVLHESGSPLLLLVQLTGTARAYRRRGIAQALKVKSMAWGKAAGYSTISVANDLANTGMLAINDRLGFVRQPALVMLQRKAPF